MSGEVKARDIKGIDDNSLSLDEFNKLQATYTGLNYTVNLAYASSNLQITGIK